MGLPQLDRQVWILSLGRLLSQTGSGFTMFYAPIFFVNQVGLSATQVGLGLGSASISGVVGRLLGGSWSDAPAWGRKRVILLAAGICAIACFVLATTTNYPVFVLGNLLLGMGMGLYWPPMEALVADLTTSAQRHEAFAISRLCDSLGQGVGVVLGGLLIRLSGAYRALFTIDGLSFLVLLAVVYWAIAHRPPTGKHGALKGWLVALSDRRLLIFAIANILFTVYLSQINSALPLYLTNFVGAGATGGGVPGQGFSPWVLSGLFTWHLVACVLLQIPVARRLNRFTDTGGLLVSAGFWILGFGAVWLTGVATHNNLVWAVLALTILALATVIYLPAASSMVIELAPESLRGIYLGVNSQCWAIGYLLGPPLGGWALDQSRPIADGFWLLLAGSVGGAIAVLCLLQTLMPQNRT